jgi:hypothetical protein
MRIARRVFTYIRFIPLPASMNTLSMLYPPIWALSTRGALPGRGTVIGWSYLLNSIGCSDQCKYSVDTRGDVIAKLTCREMLFCSLFDFGTGCIITMMCLLDGMYPPSFLFPWLGWPCPCAASFVACWVAGGALLVFPSYPCLLASAYLCPTASCSLRNVLQSFIACHDTLLPSTYA